MKIPSIKSFLFKRKHKVISSHSLVPSFFARGLKRNVLSWNSPSNFFGFSNSVLRSSFSPFLTYFNNNWDRGYGDKIRSPGAEQLPWMHGGVLLTPHSEAKARKGFINLIFIFRKMFVCIEKFFLFCTYLLLIVCFSWYLQSRFVVIKSRLKVLMKNFLYFQTIISPIDVFILCR